MGSLGISEIAFIFVLALLVFGPKKLPEIGRTLGRGMAEFRKATNELKRTINTELALEENPTPPALRPLTRPQDSLEPRREAVETVEDIEAVEPVSPPGEAPALTEARAASLPPSPEAESRPAAAPDALEPR